MKAFLMTSVMFDPSVDDETVISNFLDAYYSAKAAPFIRQYMDIMHGSIADTNYCAYTIQLIVANSLDYADVCLL